MDKFVQEWKGFLLANVGGLYSNSYVKHIFKTMNSAQKPRNAPTPITQNTNLSAAAKYYD
jgi:hypothetical protein